MDLVSGWTQGQESKRCRFSKSRCNYRKNRPRLVDRYGRLLRYVYMEGGQSIDKALIREGLALAWTRDGQHRDYLVGLEQETRADGTGPCGDYTRYLSQLCISLTILLTYLQRPGMTG